MFFILSGVLKTVSITKKCLFDTVLCVFVWNTPLPFPQIHFQTLQYRNNVSSRMANRCTRIFDAGGLRVHFPPFYFFYIFAIFGPARGQIYENKALKNQKSGFRPFGTGYPSKLGFQSAEGG